jgi:hypothetical protein
MTPARRWLGRLLWALAFAVLAGVAAAAAVPYLWGTP